MRRFLPVIFILLAGAVALYWLERSEHWLRSYFMLLAASVTVLLVLLVVVFAIARTWRARGWGIAAVLGLLAAAGLALGELVERGASAGTGFPELRWVWEEPEDPAPAPFVAAPAEPLDANTTEAATFARFLGPAGDGVVPGAPLVTDWKNHPPELLWRRPVGLGWSGFVVADGRAVTQEQEGDQELVTCYGLEDGQPLWRHANDARFSESMGGDGPRATPTIDGQFVFAMGATGILDCLELATGQPVWSRQILGEVGNLTWGKSNAPLVHGDLVIVTGGDSGPALLAFDRTTGEPAWQGEGAPAAFASPVFATLDGRGQIVTVNAESVAGYDPTSGAQIWNFPWPGTFPKASQPVPVNDDRLLVSASYGLKAALLEVADGSTVSAVWESSKLPTKFSSALVHGGYAYGLGEGRLVCVDLADGSRVWRGEKYGYGQNLLVGDTILVQAERGDVALVAADPTAFRELARLEALEGKSWNPPALAGPFLLVRNATEAACYRVAREDSRAAQPPDERLD